MRGERERMSREEEKEGGKMGEEGGEEREGRERELGKREDRKGGEEEGMTGGEEDVISLVLILFLSFSHLHQSSLHRG
jgi:hypothetical protein